MSAAQLGIAPSPNNVNQYYLFALDARENKLVNGLRYSIIDMTLEDGLGDIIATSKNIRLPAPTLTSKIMESITIIRHTNGYDYWAVVHGWESNSFYSFLVSAQGVSSSPVVSTVGPVINDDGTSSPYDNGGGYLRASPNGRRLAFSIFHRDIELFDFDPSSGLATNFLSLTLPPNEENYRGGVEFSSDGSKLYCQISAANLSSKIIQYNLQAGSPVAIANSGIVIGTARTGGSSLQRGPDDKIYSCAFTALHVIGAPNALGAASDFRLSAVPLEGRTIYALPCMPNAFPAGTTVPLRLPPTVTFTWTSTCVGTPTEFRSVVVPSNTDYDVRWDFGDITSGLANSSSKLIAIHKFSAPGEYTVKLQVILPNGSTFNSSQIVRVNAEPIINLGHPIQSLCQGQTLVLSARQSSSSTYRWQDGSTAPELVVDKAGMYAVDATANGCTTRAEVLIQTLPIQIPNIITPNGDGKNDTFVLQGICPNSWDLTLYDRWGKQIYRQENYDNSWGSTITTDGLYYYLLTNARNGKQYRGHLEVMH